MKKCSARLHKAVCRMLRAAGQAALVVDRISAAALLNSSAGRTSEWARL
jgi:hypothetical protein